MNTIDFPFDPRFGTGRRTFLWHTLKSSFLAIATAIGMLSGAEASLIVNPGFEEASGPFNVPGNGSTTISGWVFSVGGTMGGNSAALVSAQPWFGTGNYMIALSKHQTQAGGTVSTAADSRLSVSSGSLLDYSFDFYRGTSTISVILEYYDESGGYLGATGNLAISAPVTGTISGTVEAPDHIGDIASVGFRIRPTSATTVYADNFSLRVIPEPSTVVLGLAGLAMLWRLRRRA